MDTPPEIIERRKLFFKKCQTREELWAWIYYFLGDLDLPNVIVDPDSNTTLLDMVWTVYAHFAGIQKCPNPRLLFYASRDGGKTLCESVIEVLALVHLNINVVHLAAIEEQSVNAQKYVKKFFALPDLKPYVNASNKRAVEVNYYKPLDGGDSFLTPREYSSLPEPEQAKYKQISNKVEIVVATMQSVNGKHAALLCLDEIDVLKNPQVYEEAKNIPTFIRLEDGTPVIPLTVLTSTRKFAGGLVQREIDEMAKTRLGVFHWNMMDVTAACPKERHRPDLPKLPIYRDPDSLTAIGEEKYKTLDFKQRSKYQLDEGYQGCLKNCEIFAMCRGHLANRQTGDSSFLKPLEHTVNQFTVNSNDMAKAQLLCWKPSSSGLIYPMFDPGKHVITPAQAYEKIFGRPAPKKDYTKKDLVLALSQRDISWGGGMDFGSTHYFAYVHGFQEGSRAFVLGVAAYPGLNPVQQLEVCEPFKQFEPNVWPDTASPGMIKLFKDAGWKMRDWKKNAGSVVEGINTVQYKLLPALGEPEVFIIRDEGPDPTIDALIKQISEYKWAMDPAGRPTDQPIKVDDDIADAFRYWIMNIFRRRGKVRADHINRAQPVDPTGQGPKLYNPQNWMNQVLEEHTGKPPQLAERSKMTIEMPSYYGDQNAGTHKMPSTADNRKGSRIKWSFE